ncbi:MAG: M20 family metallopeptidase [Clostridiales bacterium]|nr:M20 family metallopeptidase [Clostridiales bacterium]
MKATKENAIKTLVDLIQIESVETPAEPGIPFGKENARALKYILDLMSSFGAKTKNVDNYCGWAEFGEGELFGILVHLDVVPASGNWTYPPFSGTIANGKLFGRGALDDKGPAVACIFSLAKLIQEGRIPNKRIRFIFGCDEEGGWLDLKRYAETEEVPDSGFSPDADFPVIYAEKGVLHARIRLQKPATVSHMHGGSAVNMVPDFCEASVVFSDKVLKSSLKFGLPTSLSGKTMLEYLADKLEGKDGNIKEGDFIIISANGKSAHGSTPQKGESALLKILECLSLAGDDALTAKLYKCFKFSDGSGLSIKTFGGKEGDLTLNVGKVSTDDKNIYFDLDIRYPAITSKEILKERILQALPEISSYTIIDAHDPLYVDPNSELVQKLLGAYDKVMGTKSEPIAIGGATYARFLKRGVAFGPEFPGSNPTIHQPDEHILLDDFYKLIEIYYEAIKTLCFE